MMIAGRHADAHLGERERDRRIDDNEIARRHQADPAGAHRAVDGGDHRSRARGQALDGRDERCRVDPAGRPFLEVGAGTERRWRYG